MVVKTLNVYSSTRTVSPTTSVNHKCSHALLEEEEPAQRVLSALRATVAKPIGRCKLKTLVLEDLQSDDHLICVAAMKQLKIALNVKNPQHRAENAKECFLLDGHVRVVDALNKYPDSQILQELGLFTIANATSSCQELIPVTVEINSIDTIKAAIVRYPHERSIQINGLSVYHNLTCNHKANAELLVVDHEIIPIIIERMNEFDDDVGVLYAACKLLKVLCGFDHLLKRILRAKAAFALRRTAFLDDPKYEKVKKTSREAIKRLVKAV